jgi:hypothetical protein
MSDLEQDWTTWIITTIMAALTTMIGTVVALTKYIQMRFVNEIAKLQADVIQNRIEFEEFKKVSHNEYRECQEDRFKLAVRVAQLESKEEH